MEADSLPLIVHALEKYSEWLNMWIEDQDADSEYRYAADHFLRFDPANGYFGGTTLLVYARLTDCILIHFSCSNGDDGGPTILTCFYDDDNRYVLDAASPDWQLDYMVQEFDTMRQEIFNREVEGHWVHHPEKKEEENEAS